MAHYIPWTRWPDSNRRGLAPTVLQTVTFGHLATSSTGNIGGDTGSATPLPGATQQLAIAVTYELVVGDGIEPPTRNFSGYRSTS